MIGPTCCANGVPSEGDPSYGVAIVGLAPGRDEMKTLRPFVGQNGRLVDAILENVGWSRDKCYMMNIVCHYGPHQDKIIEVICKHRNGVHAFADCCNRFDAELRSIKPRLVIPLGAPSIRYFFPNDKPSRIRGVPQWTGSYYVMPSWHPVAALTSKQVNFVDDCVRDFRKIPSILEWMPGHADVPYKVVSNTVQGQSILDSIPKNSIVALDIETDSRFTDTFDVHSDLVLSCAISFTNTTGVEETWVYPQDIIPLVHWPDDLQWCYQNGMFDINGLRKVTGSRLPLVHDTLLASYACDERGGRKETGDRTAGIHGLKVQAREFLGASFYEESIGARRKQGMHLVPLSELYEYNAKDAAYTRRLMHHWSDRMQEEETTDLYNNLLLPAANAFTDINYEGIAADRRKLEELILRWGPKYLEYNNYFQQYTQEQGWISDDFNVRSWQQLSRFLYDILGLPGGPSTRREVLEELDHPFVDALLDFKQLQQVFAHYIIPHVRDIKQDGRIHPTTLIHGTTSGRLSYHNPPIQTLPQPHTVGDYAELRAIYVPSDDEHVLLECDYSQIEIWIAAGLSNDQHMFEALYSGDYHRNTCINVMGYTDYDIMSKTDREAIRFQGKKVGFGVIYFISAQSLAKRKTGINSTIRVAQDYIDTFFELNHQYRDWAARIMKEAAESGELWTPFGRKRRFRLMVDEKQRRQAVNFPIQSIASDYTLSSLLELHPLLGEFASRVLFGVHDSIVMEVHKRYVREVLDLVHKVMERPRIDGMPSVKVEAKLGHDLYNVHELKANKVAAHCTRCDVVPPDMLNGLCMECFLNAHIFSSPVRA